MNPSQKFNKKVIGEVIAQITGVVSCDAGVSEKLVFPEDRFEVIDIQKTPTGDKVYICNQWYKPNVPQLIPAVFVREFIAKK